TKRVSWFANRFTKETSMKRSIALKNNTPFTKHLSGPDHYFLPWAAYFDAMKKIVVIVLVMLHVVPVLAQTAKPVEKPRLVVGIVVDQMRMEYLNRFGGKFGEGGFKRMMTGGFILKNAHYNYVPTYTGPGHASIFTGTTPAIHGIIGNDW